MHRRRFIQLASVAGLSTTFPAASWAQGEGLLAHLDVPQDVATPLRYFDRLVTPTDVFFIRSHFGAPALDRGRRLTVQGSQRTLELAASDLKKFEQVTLTAVLQCAGNGRSLHQPRVPGVQWIHGAMGQAAWTGVRLKDVLEKAGIGNDAAHVRIVGYDAPPLSTVPQFIRGLPLARALDPSTLIAHTMNGEPLSLAHGAPMRLVVPGWAGDHWMKWVKHIRVQATEPEGFYYQTAYRMPKTPVAPGSAVKPEDTLPATTLPVKSIIAAPNDGERLAMGAAEIRGIGFSGDAALQRVEVSVDGGAHWSDATLEGVGGVGRWQVFRYPFEGKPGEYVALARATDAAGHVQPEKAVWNPSGYFWNAWHRVSFRVTS